MGVRGGTGIGMSEAMAEVASGEGSLGDGGAEVDLKRAVTACTGHGARGGCGGRGRGALFTWGWARPLLARVRSGCELESRQASHWDSRRPPSAANAPSPTRSRHAPPCRVKKAWEMAHNPPHRDRLHHDRDPEPNTRPPLMDPPRRRPSSAHKRSVSQNILSRLPFLRTSSDDLPAAHADLTRASKEVDLDGSLAGKRAGGSMALAHSLTQHQTSGRRRRGSLRKTAILGTRQRSGDHSLHQRPLPTKMDTITTSPTSPKDTSTATTHSPRAFTYANPSATSSSDSGWSGGSSAAAAAAAAGPRISTTSGTTQLEHETPGAGVLASPISSPVTSPVANPYASTTDDDNDSLTFRRPAASGGHHSPSYFSMQSLGVSSSLQRRRSAKTTSTTRHSSPLSLPPATLDIDEWDYSETEWWGWVVLIVTWIVFVVGMGSCLEVWSWAWDVGETPYAPPELEDDPTLPIVGYYPALMVLTAVMAWVWVVVAWVGMKYFRHAKVVGDDG